MVTCPLQEKLSVLHLISIQNNTVMPYRSDSLSGHYSNPFSSSGGLGSAWMTSPTIPQDHQQLKLFKHNHSCCAVNSPRLSMAIVTHNISNSLQFCIYLNERYQYEHLHTGAIANVWWGTCCLHNQLNLQNTFQYRAGPSPSASVAGLGAEQKLPALTLRLLSEISVKA